MVGNDVVDLADREAQEAQLHPRFDRRVFAPPERAALESSGAPERLRWMLWAAKEAAYKLVRKRDARVAFVPASFVVSLDATLRGRVTHERESFVVVLASEGDALHAVVTEEGETATRVLAAVAKAEGDDASAAVRRLALEVLAPRLGVPADALRIGRRGRIPTLDAPGLGRLDLSLSHHGRYVAFACDPAGPGDA